MEREHRYLVVKLKDINLYLTVLEKLELDKMLKKVREAHINRNKRLKNYVVVADDWPMYEDTWQAIEKWVDAPTEKYDRADDALDLAQPNVHKHVPSKTTGTDDAD